MGVDHKLLKGCRSRWCGKGRSNVAVAIGMRGQKWTERRQACGEGRVLPRPCKPAGGAGGVPPAGSRPRRGGVSPVRGLIKGGGGMRQWGRQTWAVTRSRRHGTWLEKAMMPMVVLLSAVTGGEDRQPWGVGRGNSGGLCWRESGLQRGLPERRLRTPGGAVRCCQETWAAARWGSG